MSWINLTALWKIVVFGLIAGAGLPALFAGGLYALSLGPRGARVATAGGGDAGRAGGGGGRAQRRAGLGLDRIRDCCALSNFEDPRYGRPS